MIGDIVIVDLFMMISLVITFILFQMIFGAGLYTGVYIAQNYQVGSLIT